MWRLHNHCRACGFGKTSSPPGIKAAPSDEKLVKVFSLSLQPLPNDFKKEDEEHEGHAPLEVLFCPRCTLAQLSVVVRPDIMYKNYAYITSRSATMRRHFDSLLEYIRSECEPVSLVEVGSNDGYFLEYAKKNGAEFVCGIDASENLSQVARENGIQTIFGILDKDTAQMAHACVPVVDCIVARHVFGHVDDLKSFVNAMDSMSNKNTLILIEVPWAKRLLERCEFDTIYFEHLSYITIKSMAALLESTPFRLHRIHEFPVHGGALGIMIRRRDHESVPHPTVKAMMSQENITVETWKEMAERSKRSIRNLISKVADEVSNGNTICGYGASAKFTVWMNACGFTKKEIKFVTDTTLHKQGCTVPGTDIPVVDAGALLRELPDFTILGAWNFAEEIISQEHLYREKGGQFIVPHAEFSASSNQ